MSSLLPLDLWSEIKKACVEWFLTPQQVLVPIAAMILFAAITLSRRWRRLVVSVLLSIALAYSLLISPLGASFSVTSLTLFLPADQGQSADAIVVLGRGTLAEYERCQLAAQFWQDKRAPFILTTGYGEAPRMSAKLTQMGIPLAAQVIEPQARTTEENAQRSVELLDASEVEQIILITDTPHMLRSFLTFRSFGFKVIPHTVDVPTHLPSAQITALALREYLGLVSYGLLGRFQPRLKTAQAFSVNLPSIA